MAALRSNPLKKMEFRNVQLFIFIFSDDKFSEIYGFRASGACGRVTFEAVNTLLTLTSKELESLNLNTIIRLRLNSRISREFDPPFLMKEFQVPSVNINIISNNFRHSS